MRRWTRVCKFAAWTIVTTALLVEVLLQVGALAVYLVNRSPSRIEHHASGKVVLCVGDSWTHGMGCSDSTKHSYPAQLEKGLREQEGATWRVANGGQSGQNSRDVLLRLESQIQENQPSVVCVLVGRNDRWSRPAEVVGDTTAESHRSYRFRWRLPRLIAWIAESASVQPAPIPTDGPEWRTKELPRVEAHRDEPWSWANTAEIQSLRRSGWERIAANDHHGAIEKFEAARALADDPETHGALANSYRMVGDSERSLASLRWLQDEWSRTKSVWVGSPLMHALAGWSRDADSLQVCREFTQAFPLDATAWGELGRACYNLGRYEEAREHLVRCMATDASPSYYASLRCRVETRLQRPEDALRALFSVYAANNDTAWADNELNVTCEMSTFTNQMLVDTLAAFECAPDVKKRLGILVDNAMRARDGEAARRVLVSHLHQIVNKCRLGKATPVFLEYPIDTPYRGTLSEVAKELDVLHIDVHSWFRDRLTEAQIQAMRSPDGHVNDEGYRLMAECVLAGIRPALK